MYITLVSTECAPIAKAGGLGDFIHGLARELLALGNEVEVFLPKYDCLRYDLIAGLHKDHAELWVSFYEQWIPCDVESGDVDGVRCSLIDPHSVHGLFNRGRIYGEADDADRFAFFSRAVLEFLYKSGRRPDIIHCHDWHTGLVPVLFYEIYAALGMDRTRLCYTLHNLGHQGRVGEHILRQVGLNPARLMQADRLLDPYDSGTVNLMKGGIIYSNYVTTVSPRYAWEIQHTDQGMGLQAVLRTHAGKLGGVLNGIDYRTWSPAIDPWIPLPFGPDNLPQKAASKAALRERYGLRKAHKPIVVVVSRLDAQKGVDLIRHGVHFALANGCQVALLGSAPDPTVDEQFRQIRDRMQDNLDCHIELAYDEALSHLLYAAADIILIPSVYEPCGLTQMIAMKYGAVPVVRRVGGLADTVFDANDCDKPFEQRNGYLFDDLTESALESALSRAIGLWFSYPEYFRQLRINGMRQDNSWTRPGREYLAIYDTSNTKL